jgi:methylenetetrahydrofolate--tRNA-(uracil-5-)-methyltransferase
MTTALGALLAHITKNANMDTFQPMNINFGLMPEIDQTEVKFTHSETGEKLRGKARMHAKKRARQTGFTSRARQDFEIWRPSH